MYNLIQKIKQLWVALKLERIYNIFIILIVMTILELSFLASSRSISLKQYNSIYSIAHQSRYAGTQKMALGLLIQDHICVRQYLKLMLALQIEQKKAKKLPAISVN